jgi:hypothetical protein
MQARTEYGTMRVGGRGPRAIPYPTHLVLHAHPVSRSPYIS